MEEGVGEQVGVLDRVVPGEGGLETGEDLVEGLLHQDSLVEMLGVDHGEGVHHHEVVEDLAGLDGELVGVVLDGDVRPDADEALEHVLEAGGPATKVQERVGGGGGLLDQLGGSDGVEGVKGGDSGGVVDSVGGGGDRDLLDLRLKPDGRAHEIVEVLGRAVELVAGREGHGDVFILLNGVAVGAIVGIESERAVRVQSGETKDAGEGVLALLLLYDGGDGVVHLRDLRGLHLLEEAEVNGVGEEVHTTVAVRKLDTGDLAGGKVGRELDRHDIEHGFLVCRKRKTSFVVVGIILFIGKKYNKLIDPSFFSLI